MRRVLGILLMVITMASSSHLWAQLGYNAEPVLEALADFELRETDVNSYITPERNRIRFNYEYGIFTSLEGKITLFDEGIDLATTAISAAAINNPEGFAEAIENLLRNEDLKKLVGKARQNVELGRYYVMQLDVTQGFEREYIVNFVLEPSIPFLVDESRFPVAMHALGPEDAPYVIREFSDFQCPYCTRFALNGLPVVKNALLSRGDVRFEFHHFPLHSIHPNAGPAAEAALCVVEHNSPDDFWAYHDALFERQNAWSGLGDPYPYFVRLARDLRLEHRGVADCLEEGRYVDAVREAYQQATTLGARGTPTLFVNNIRVQNDYSDVATYLELFALIDAQNAEVADSDAEESSQQSSDAPANDTSEDTNTSSSDTNN